MADIPKPVLPRPYVSSFYNTRTDKYEHLPVIAQKIWNMLYIPTYQRAEYDFDYFIHHNPWPDCSLQDVSVSNLKNYQIDSVNLNYIFTPSDTGRFWPICEGRLETPPAFDAIIPCVEELVIVDPSSSSWFIEPTSLYFFTYWYKYDIDENDIPSLYKSTDGKNWKWIGWNGTTTPFGRIIFEHGPPGSLLVPSSDLSEIRLFDAKMILNASDYIGEMIPSYIKLYNALNKRLPPFAETITNSFLSTVDSYFFSDGWYSQKQWHRIPLLYAEGNKLYILDLDMVNDAFLELDISVAVSQGDYLIPNHNVLLTKRIYKSDFKPADLNGIAYIPNWWRDVLNLGIPACDMALLDKFGDILRGIFPPDAAETSWNNTPLLAYQCDTCHEFKLPDLHFALTEQVLHIRPIGNLIVDGISGVVTDFGILGFTDSFISSYKFLPTEDIILPLSNNVFYLINDPYYASYPWHSQELLLYKFTRGGTRLNIEKIPGVWAIITYDNNGIPWDVDCDRFVYYLYFKGYNQALETETEQYLTWLGSNHYSVGTFHPLIVVKPLISDKLEILHTDFEFLDLYNINDIFSLYAISKTNFSNSTLYPLGFFFLLYCCKQNLEP